SKLKTFRDIASAEDEDSEEEHENYFAGGEKSGVMMQGGPKAGKKEPSELIKDILEKAAKGGGAKEESVAAKKPTYFVGSGHRLGSEDEPAPAPTPSAPARPRVPGPEEGSGEVVERALTFWRNGFSIEDGPLLRYDDPQNEEFLRAINSGRAPTAMLNVAFGQRVDVKVAHRMQEDYKPPPKKPVSAFSGSGQRLGGVTSPSASGSSSSGGGESLPGAFPSTLGLASSESTSAPAATRSFHLTVDSSAPVTSLQIRLADGTRLVAKLNHTHTIQDLRNYIEGSSAGSAGRSYVLQTTFPNRDLVDLNMTLKDAGLLNAVMLSRQNLLSRPTIAACTSRHVLQTPRIAPIISITPIACTSASTSTRKFTTTTLTKAQYQQQQPKQQQNQQPIFNNEVLATEKPSDITYFTGNPRYFNLLMRTNNLIRKHGLPFQSKEPYENLNPSTLPRWMSMLDMQNLKQFKLTENMYDDLIHKFNLLFTVKDSDKETERLLLEYVRPGDALASLATQQETLDEDGRSHTRGSRKTAKAQVWVVEGDGLIYVNGKHIAEYFGEISYREMIVKPFEVVGGLGKYNVWGIVEGGGAAAQAGAVAVAVARGLVVHDPGCRETLEALGLTKIDTRQVERKKTGQPGARKKKSWVKR
ncbi:hypothetical protein HDU76_013050, partial [Blyttiomyces sp. JEL0837]